MARSWQLASDWDPSFAGKSPAFELFAPEVLGELARLKAFPPVAAWNRLLAPGGVDNLAPLRFAPQDKRAVREAGGYDGFIRQTLTIPSREKDWHDLLNALVWTHLPDRASSSARRSQNSSRQRSSRTASSRLGSLASRTTPHSSNSVATSPSVPRRPGSVRPARSLSCCA